MDYKQKLVKQIKDELVFQKMENETGTEEYNQASEYHTSLISSLNILADKYPNFIDILLKQHIDEEEKIFGDDTSQFDLTQYEKGRIYSLVRCRHMIRIAKEESGI
ncbi:MAG TPA: hypothetical protein GX703_02660 [Erysipelothrix sp.]|jgi:hypothetical protein|nr:hypothetical protein [Erysipelothrix sp.]